MNNAVITLKTDLNLKTQAMKLADDLGFSLSSLINAYLKNLVRTKTVNYSLADENQPSAMMLKELKRSTIEIKKGKISPAFSDPQDAVKWLKND